jgi:hypothetical protein
LKGLDLREITRLFVNYLSVESPQRRKNGAGQSSRFPMGRKSEAGISGRFTLRNKKGTVITWA